MKDGELRQPIKRRYDESNRRKHAGDSAERAFRLQRLTFGFMAAGYMSIPIAILVLVGRVSPLIAIGILVGTIATVYVGSGLVSGGGATLASKIYAPSGKSTPRRAEYSKAQSFVMRGQYRDAAVAYEVHCLENPTDPEPYLRIVEIYQKHLDEPEEAVAWLLRARADANLTAGEEMRVIQTIVEIYVRQLRTPRKAIPELVQLTQRFPDTEAAEAAERELAAMRTLLAEESEGLASFTTQFLEKLEKGLLGEAATKSREQMERDMIAEALVATDNNHKAAAQRLGISLEKLETAIRDLRL